MPVAPQSHWNEENMYETEIEICCASFHNIFAMHSIVLLRSKIVQSCRTFILSSFHSNLAAHTSLLTKKLQKCLISLLHHTLNIETFKWVRCDCASGRTIDKHLIRIQSIFIRRNFSYINLKWKMGNFCCRTFFLLLFNTSFWWHFFCFSLNVYCTSLCQQRR